MPVLNVRYAVTQAEMASCPEHEQLRTVVRYDLAKKLANYIIDTYGDEIVRTGSLNNDATVFDLSLYVASRKELDEYVASAKKGEV